MASEKPIIVIVPGAFHRPDHYRKISNPLRAQGYEVMPISLVVCGDDDVDPASTHFDDAAKIQRQLVPLLDTGRRAIIVSHSYGSLPATASVQGQTISERAERGLNGGIIAVISIAGFVFPARGKSIMGDDQISPPMSYHIVENGIVRLHESAKAIFFSDLPPTQADIEWEDLHAKQSRKSFTTFPQYVESEIQCPKTYILCENDTAVPPEFQEQMARMGNFDIIRVASSHAPFLTVPNDVVAVVVNVAEKAA